MLRAIVEQVENEQVEEAFHESIGDSLAHGPRIYRNTRISRFDITLPLETRRFERNSGRVRKLINPYRPVQEEKLRVARLEQPYKGLRCNDCLSFFEGEEALERCPKC